MSEQLSFFSADLAVPSVADLAGLLAAHGQVFTSGGVVRVSVVLDARWRAEVIAQLVGEAGLTSQLRVLEPEDAEQGGHLVRTDSSPELAALGRAWTKGAVKHLPMAGFLTDERCAPGRSRRGAATMPATSSAWIPMRPISTSRRRLHWPRPV